MKEDLKKVHKELQRWGLLMLADPQLPSLVRLITGESVKGSWWGHPQGNLIYNLSQELMDDPNILSVKLINKKITFISEKNRQSLFSIASSGESWQFKKISSEAQELLALVKKEGSLRLDDPRFKKNVKEVAKWVSALEEKLLVHCASVHTDSGKHVRVLTSWPEFIKKEKNKSNKTSYQDAIEVFEKIKTQWSQQYSAKVKFPWD